MNKKDFIVFGVEALDSSFPGALRPGTMMLIAGHPGAGKTTFAATMCYRNAMKGYPCLYISFIEDKDKFASYMGSLGLDFRPLEARGLFKYMKLPILTEKSGLTDLSTAIFNEAVKGGFRLVVLDSITSIISVFSHETPEFRSVLQNFLHMIARQINGVLVVIAELPYATVRLPIQDVEFVADVAIMMKHRIEKARLVRVMEIRKIRGSPVNVAEVPFTIREGEGIRVFIPPVLEEISGLNLELELKMPCKALDEAFKGHIHKGMITSLIIQPGARYIPLSVIALSKLIIEENMKVALVSFKYVTNEMLHYFSEQLNSLGLESVAAEFMKKIAAEKSLNPAGFSIEELTHQILDLINSTSLDVLILDGVEILFKVFEDEEKVFSYFLNILHHLKSRNIWSILVYSDVDKKVTSLLRDVSDVIIEGRFKEPDVLESGELKPYEVLWKIGCPPYVLDSKALMGCIKEAYGKR